VLVLVVLFSIVIDNGRAHPVAAHDRRIFLLRHDQTPASFRHSQHVPRTPGGHMDPSRTRSDPWKS
jgi:hypothetical protein